MLTLRSSRWPNLGSLEGYTVMPGDPYHNFTFSGWDYPYFSGFNLYGTAEQRIDVSTNSKPVHSAVTNKSLGRKTRVD